MNKLFNLAKVTGLVALLAFMFIGAMPADSTASVATELEVDAAPNRDCNGDPTTCFIRVNDNGDITVYNLGKLLSAN